MTQEAEAQRAIERILKDHYAQLHQHWQGKAPIPSLHALIGQLQKASREALKQELLSKDMKNKVEEAIKDKWAVVGASTYSVAKAAIEAMAEAL